jgi:hypothetical protein
MADCAEHVCLCAKSLKQAVSSQDLAWRADALDPKEISFHIPGNCISQLHDLSLVLRGQRCGSQWFVANNFHTQYKLSATIVPFMSNRRARVAHNSLPRPCTIFTVLIYLDVNGHVLKARTVW